MLGSPGNWLIVRYFWFLLGGLSILAGLITVWMPIPIGLPLMAIGATILLRTSDTFRRWVMRRRAANDRLNRALIGLGRRLPWPYRRIVNRTVPLRHQRRQ